MIKILKDRRAVNLSIEVSKSARSFWVAVEKRREKKIFYDILHCRYKV